MQAVTGFGGKQQRTHQMSTDGSGTHDSEARKLHALGQRLADRPMIPPMTRQSSQRKTVAVRRSGVPDHAGIPATPLPRPASRAR